MAEAVENQASNSEASGEGLFIKVLASLCAVMSCVSYVIILLSGLFLLYGFVIIASYPQCPALHFGGKKPSEIFIDDLRNLSTSEWMSMLAGKYKLSNEYNLKLTQDNFEMYSLCVVKNHFTHLLACVEIGTTEQLQLHVICNPDMRPDCLPSAIVGHWFGLSLWYQEEFTVEYTVMDIDSSEIFSRNLTGTSPNLSSVWLDVLDCQRMINITIAVIFFGIQLCICCLGQLACCLWICCQVKKTLSGKTRSIAFGRKVTEWEGSLRGIIANETGVDETPLVSSDVLSNDWQQDENLQQEVFPSDLASSTESVQTAVSERGPRSNDSSNGTSVSKATSDVSDESSDEVANVAEKGF